MKKLINSFSAFVVLALIVAVTTLLIPHIGLGSSTVGTNAPTTQTQNVNVVNTPAVTAQQSGTWNVGISGTPTVGLATGTSVSVDGTLKIDSQNNTIKIDGANNMVKIDGTSPIPVRDVDNPARQPFQTNLQFFLQDGSFGDQQSFAVPANKRLVIEYISADSGVPVGQLARIGVYTSLNNLFTLHYVVTNRLGTVGNGDDEFVAGQPTTIYADPGTQVFVGFTKNAGQGFANCSITLSGHLVNLP